MRLPGSSARERGVSEVVCAPGNAGIATTVRTVAIDAADTSALSDFAARERIDLTVVGPELPLDRGIADLSRSQEAAPVRAVACRGSARVQQGVRESVHGPPRDPDGAVSCLRRSAASATRWSRRGELGFPVVVKADGLAAGKGVVVAPDATTADARDSRGDGGAAVRRRRAAGRARGVPRRVRKCRSLRSATAAVPWLSMSAQDHKRVFDGDRGAEHRRHGRVRAESARRRRDAGADHARDRRSRSSRGCARRASSTAAFSMPA